MRGIKIKTAMQSNEKNNSYFPIIDIIKAAACIMIFLYHCNTILPDNWKFLTLLGQDMGNNFFFMVSGFALAGSIDRTDWKGFPKWYFKRLIRILPITAIAYTGSYFMGFYSFADMSQIITVFIYPTLYWFVSAILLYYIILFILAKTANEKVLFIIETALFVLFVIFSERLERLYIIGLIAMIMGYMVKKNIDKSEQSGKDIFIIFVLLGFFITKSFNIKYLTNILSDLCVLIAGASLLIIGQRNNERLSDFFSVRKPLKAVIKYVGGMALPLYLVQSFCSGYIGYMISLSIPFPRSFLINFLIVWGIGTILYFISNIPMKFL